MIGKKEKYLICLKDRDVVGTNIDVIVIINEDLKTDIIAVMIKKQKNTRLNPLLI